MTLPSSTSPPASSILPLSESAVCEEEAVKVAALLGQVAILSVEGNKYALGLDR